MLYKYSVSWNEGYSNDGILYFAQRIVEMLDYRTIDLFRAPINNSTSIVGEYISAYNKDVKEYHLEAIFQEAKHTLQNDIVLISRFGKDQLNDVINKFNTGNDRISLMKYVFHTISPQYLKWAIDYLKDIVIIGSEKKKIERAIKCFIPELVNSGYSRDDIYQRAKEILFSSSPREAINTFFDYYDKKEKKFTVYFGLYKELRPFSELLQKRLGIKIVDEEKVLETWDNYFEVVQDDIKALDAVSAADKVKQQTELFTNYYQFFGNYSGNVIQKNAVVVAEDGKKRSVTILCDKYNSIEEDDNQQIGDLSEKIVTCLLNSSRCSFDLINRITKLHNRAISNNGLQNGFLNLWSILEMLGNKGENKLQKVLDFLVPILQKDFFRATVEDIYQNIKNVLPQTILSTVFEKIEEEGSEYEKVAMLLLLPKYKAIFDSFVDSFLNYPVLRSRMININDSYSNNKKALSNRIEEYKTRIIWHMHRIYRCRNAIVHNGQKPKQIKDIGEHLHAYVDAAVSNVIIKLSLMHLCDVSNVYISDQFELEKLLAALNKKEVFDAKTVNILFHPEKETLNSL